MRRITGADTVSLFIYSESNPRPELMLHEGAGAPVFGLENEPLAAKFALRMTEQRQARQDDDIGPLLEVHRNGDGASYLIALDIARIRTALNE